MTLPLERPAWCPPEHLCGTRPAYEAGCRGDSCRLMMVIHTRDDPPVARPVRRIDMVDAAPYAVLLRALIRDGYTLTRLSDRTRISRTELRLIALEVTTAVFPPTAAVLRSLTCLLPSEVSA